MARSAETVNLQSRTLDAFTSYVRDAEAGMGAWNKFRDEQITARFWSGQGPVKVPDGLIHDWIGTALIPNATVRDALALIQDYDNHKNIYRPEVIDSKLIARDKTDFQIYLRLLKRKIITVILDTDHDVHYEPVARGRWRCISHTTRIAEVENAGKPNERVLEADTGFGFLWRLYSYWRFEQSDAGVFVECRAISLTRDVPRGLGWVVEPIIRHLPKESLINALKATREGVLARARGRQ